MEADVLIRGGEVIDGSGAAPVRADVAVRGGRIEAVDVLPDDVVAAEVLDASGRVVTPGFVDVHLHTDCAPLRRDDESVRAGLPSLRQGVTSEVCGNCGFSPFPTPLPSAGVTGDLLVQALGEGARWFESYGEYRDDLAARELGPNYAHLVGHGALRMASVGFDDRPATGDELESMRRLLDRSLSDGCVGFSSGLIYPPGMFAGTDELVALAEVAGRHERLYTTHMRDESDAIDDAIDEAIEIGRRGGASVQISHHKVAGHRNWERSAETLARIERAASDLDVAFDVYPYTASSTGLLALMPREAVAGGMDQLVGRLHDPEARAELRALDATAPSTIRESPEVVVFADSATRPDVIGRTLADLAAEVDAAPFDAACDLLAQDPTVSVILHKMAEEDVERILAHPLAMIGSDGGLDGGRPHPRRAGTFARVLGRYVRERATLDLPSAVHKMTARPARRFGLGDRGLVRRGSHADLVVLDPATVLDGATYEAPLTPPVGVEHVLVNGRVVVRAGADTGVRAGTVLAA